VLAPHVVRPRRDRPQGWAAQYELAVAEAQQVSQVGLAAGKLPDAQRERKTSARAKIEVHVHRFQEGAPLD